MWFGMLDIQEIKNGKYRDGTNAFSGSGNTTV
jgi:hypothetical protein